MEKEDQLVVEKLIEIDPEFKTKYKAHKDCENKLEKLEKKPRLSPSETLEKKKLKKLKLAIKDEMKQRIAEYQGK